MEKGKLYINEFTGAIYGALSGPLFQDDNHTYDEPFFVAVRVNGTKEENKHALHISCKTVKEYNANSTNT